MVALASDLEDMITRYRPQFWVHRHVYHAVDYWIGGTRSVCSPSGYHTADWAEDTRWEEDLMIYV